MIGELVPDFASRADSIGLEKLAQLGCLRLIQRRHPEHPIQDPLALFVQACEGGHADTARWLCTELHITKVEVLTLRPYLTEPGSPSPECEYVACRPSYFREWVMHGKLRPIRICCQLFELTRAEVISVFTGSLAGWRCRCQLELFRWLTETFSPAKGEVDAGRFFSELCRESGVLAELDWIKRAFGLGKADVEQEDFSAFLIACGAGALENAKWLVATFGLTAEDVRAGHNYAFRTACGGGHLALAQWLYTEFKLTPRDAAALDNNAQCYAEAGGHVAVAAWLQSISREAREKSPP